MVEFRFKLPPDRWDYLKLHAQEELYEQAEVSFNGTNIGSVGLRFKGSWGTLYSCMDDAGNLTCDKLSMFVKFNEYDDKLRCFGLKRLNFHSMLRDPSKLHDRLAYDIFRSQGISAPRSSWAKLVVNDEPMGLYAMVEAIDGRFTDERWSPVGDGNLYKEAWPASVDPNYYSSRLETNEESATHDGFIAFANALENSPVGRRSPALFDYMDRDYLYRYLAIDDAINNWDGIANFSCASGFCSNHNFFVYEEQSRPYFWLIPWDLDNSFSLSSPLALIPHWQYPITDCSSTLVLNGSHKMAPACNPVFAALAEDLTGYRNAIDELLAGDFEEAALVAAIERHAAFIADAVRADPKSGGYDAWQTALSQLKSDIVVLRQRLSRLRDQVPMVPLTLEKDKLNGFENEDALTLALGQNSMANRTSVIRTSIQTTNALEGSRSLRVDFEYRNDLSTDAAWSQWSSTALSLAGGAQDLSKKTGLRMVLRADQRRTVTLSLDSPNYGKSKHFGWSATANTTPTVVSLPFTAAAIPAWAGTTTDQLATILAAVNGISIGAECLGRNTAGLLPDGMSDSGFLEVDSLEFFTE